MKIAFVLLLGVSFLLAGCVQEQAEATPTPTASLPVEEPADLTFHVLNPNTGTELGDYECFRLPPNYLIVFELRLLNENGDSIWISNATVITNATTLAWEFGERNEIMSLENKISQGGWENELRDWDYTNSSVILQVRGSGLWLNHLYEKRLKLCPNPYEQPQNKTTFG